MNYILFELEKKLTKNNPKDTKFTALNFNLFSLLMLVFWGIRCNTSPLAHH